MDFHGDAEVSLAGYGVNSSDLGGVDLEIIGSLRIFRDDFPEQGSAGLLFFQSAGCRIEKAFALHFFHGDIQRFYFSFQFCADNACFQFNDNVPVLSWFLFNNPTALDVPPAIAEDFVFQEFAVPDNSVRCHINTDDLFYRISDSIPSGRNRVGADSCDDDLDCFFRFLSMDR